MDSKKIVMVNRVYYMIVLILLVCSFVLPNLYVKGTENAAVEGFRLMFWIGVAIVCISLIKGIYVDHLLGKIGDRDRLDICSRRIWRFSLAFMLCDAFFVYFVTDSINAEFLVEWAKIFSILPIFIMGYVLAARPKINFVRNSGKCRKGSLLHSIEYLLFFIITGKNVVVTGLAVIVSFLPAIAVWFPQYMDYCYYIGVVVATVELGLFLLFLLYLQIKFVAIDIVIAIFIGFSEIVLCFAFLSLWSLNEAFKPTVLFVIALEGVMAYFLFGSGFSVDCSKGVFKNSKSGKSKRVGAEHQQE